MKDIVENRSRIGLGRKLKLARLALRENGLPWCTCLLVYYFASALAHRAFGWMDRIRRERNIPGLNSTALNREIWQAWDWSAQGEEWSESDAWKHSLIRSVLQPNIPSGCSVLEIGPGAGRWTGPLLQRARQYVGIDISSTCIEHCQKSFGQHEQARFAVGSGRDLSGVATGSIDAIWSFDVFVHINAADVAAYLTEFVRVLRPGGIAVIHHGAVGGAQGGWRSNLTATVMHEMVGRAGLRTEQVLSQWPDRDTVQRLSYGDLITVMSKPAVQAA